MAKKKHCYYISYDGYDSLNDHEGRWKYVSDEEEPFQHYYPKGWDGVDCKPLDDNEFEISADFESGGWGIWGNLELFEKWVDEHYNGDVSNIYLSIFLPTPKWEEEDGDR